MIKMTQNQNVNLNEMTTDRKIKPNYKDDLEYRSKDLFIWALGESAITEMTRTVRDHDTNRMDDIDYIRCSGYTSYRNETNSTEEQIYLEYEKNTKRRKICGQGYYRGKNCEFEKVTAAELLASKFLSVIGRSTGEYELKKKFRKKDMTIETITVLIHEHM